MIFTCIKYTITGLVYIFVLQRFSCIFESTEPIVISSKQTDMTYYRPGLEVIKHFHAQIN